MIKKKMTCIECPNGCIMTVDVDNCKVTAVSDFRCPKGREYAISETENPSRIITSAVVAEGLGVKMVSVRTDKAVPKFRLMEVMAEIKKSRVTRPVAVGDIIIADVCGMGMNVVSTMRAK